MVPVEEKGSQELLTRRMFLAVISSVMLQFFFVCCLVLFANLSVDYVCWLQETWSIVTSLRMWAFVIVFSTVVFLQAGLCRRIYLHTPPYYKSRFTKLLATFTTQNVFLGMLYVLIGGVMIWFHLSLKSGRYSSMIMDCSMMHGTCLIEEYSFLLFSGPWSGLYFAFKTRSSIGRYFWFPIIAQSKFSLFRRRIYAVLPTLMISSIWSTLYYITVYYFLGSYCRMALPFGMISMETETELDVMSKLLSLSLISQLWFYQFTFILTITSTYLFFEVYLTEWTQFRFGTSGELDTSSSGLTLIEALSMDKIPIMQHLGYLDLVTLAQKEKARRAVLFTLSQPGGHPYTWNCIVQRCTGLLGKFSADLNAITVKPQDQLSCYRTSVLTTMGRPAKQQDYMYHMRKLVPDVAPTLAAVETIRRDVSYAGWFAQFVKQKRDGFVTYLLSKPLINYVFGEQDENKIRHILFNGQPVMWAAEAISSLLVFSLTEDHHGIVQKDIPIIINTLLSVKQALDKQQKSAILARRLQMEDKLIREIFTSLRSAVKRSLYRIVTNFEPYIDDLCLEAVSTEQLQSFLNYKE